jgi:hypothetical protein
MYWSNPRLFDQLQQQMRDTLTLFIVVDTLKQSDYFALFQVKEMCAKH